MRSWARARVEGGDEVSPRGRCSERRSRRGLYVSRTQDARPRRGLDDARCLREPSEARGVDLVVLRDEGRNTSADVWREAVDAEPRMTFLTLTNSRLPPSVVEPLVRPKLPEMRAVSPLWAMQIVRSPWLCVILTLTMPRSAKPHRRRSARKRGPAMTLRNDLQNEAAAR